jgi:hypothetical protein
VNLVLVIVIVIVIVIVEGFITSLAAKLQLASQKLLGRS